MDILSLGFTLNSKKSNKIIKIINNNNRISLAIKTKFEKLNSYTKQYLSTQYQSQQLQKQQKVNSSQIQSTTNESLQEVFKEIYFLIDCENFKFDKLSNLNLLSLQQIYSKLDFINIKNLTKDDKILLDLINEYVILLTSLKLSNSLILKTLILKNQEIYWLNISNSIINKLIYFIQTLPINSINFSIDIFKKTNKILSNNFKLNDIQDEEENQSFIKIKFKQLKRLSHAVYKSIFQTIEVLFVQDNPVIALLSKTDSKTSFSSIKYYITSFIKFPITIVNKDINNKLSLIKKEIKSNTIDINTLVTSQSSSSPLSDNYLPILTKILQIDENGSKQINQIIESVIKFDSKQYTKTSKPSFLTRYWVLIILFIRYAPSQSKKIYNNKQEIINWIQYNGIEPIKGFFINWVIKPINEMLNILRSDNEITITTKDSLKSDINSLEKMIYEFTIDNNIKNVTPTEINQDVKNGDLKIIMSRYENEIRKPIKYLINGSLLRLILIQVQKGKVDGGVAINGIDKLLKSQQLVFGIVSMSPSIIILYQLYNYFTSSKPLIVNGKQLSIICLKSLNNIENLLILLDYEEEERNKLKQYQDQKQIELKPYEGELLIEIINLILNSQPLIPKELQNDWIFDLNEINNNSYSIKIKLNLISKIWNMYGSYFK
ncbi:NCA2 [Candida pseudojiufengensis]|uniref:NCA2 n=1 Tax=Candida pseudojiufengensis TaxID=497109 RepID=UPI002224EEF0|nr:NCA2 [Candida pseudojiufengensis]KAI5965255.1 NCA2 [Candida pseudojiufengensis]